MKAWLVSLSQQQRVSWALLVALLALLIVAYVAPLLDRFNVYYDASESNARTLSSLRYVLHSRDQLMSTRASLQTEGLDTWVYPPENSVSQISLAMQKLVSSTVSAQNGTVLSISAEKPVARDNLVEPGVKVDFQGDMAAVLGVLSELETARPLLVVDDVVIKPKRQRRRRVAAVQTQELSVQLVVRTFTASADEEAE